MAHFVVATSASHSPYQIVRLPCDALLRLELHSSVKILPEEV